MKTYLRDSFHSMSLRVVDPQRGSLSLKTSYNGYGLTMSGFKPKQTAMAKATLAKANALFRKCLGKKVRFPKGVKTYGEFMAELERIGKISKDIPGYLSAVNRWLGGS